MRSAAFTLLLLVATVLSSFAALTIDDYTDATNDRFANNGAFILNAYNLSGVGRAATDNQWATMVSSNVFVSSNHFHPAIGSTIYFHPGNDPSVAAITRTVTSGEMMRENGTNNNTDIWAGVLDSPLPSTIASYAYSTEVITAANFPTSGLVFKVAAMVGISPGSVATDFGEGQAAGINLIDGMQEFTGVGTTDDFLVLGYNAPGHPNYLTYESIVNTGDSGSPLFYDEGGVLKLAGTGTFRLTSGGAPAGSAYSYIGDSSIALSNYIQTNAVPIPEPTTALLIALGVLGVIRFRHTR